MTALSQDEVADLTRKIAVLEERLRSAAAERDAAVERQTAATLEQFRLQTELRAALDRQKASAEILRSIGATSGDAAHALRQIAETTARFFSAPSVTIRIAEADRWVQDIRVGGGSLASGAHPGSPLIERGASLPATVYRENRQIHIGDLDNIDPSMAHWPAVATRAVGIRTISGTPLRRDGKAIGALIIYRDRLAPFTDEELALQQSFADQAVIAIENARLFNETQEALARQTATSEILRVISGSPTDVQPVFDAIVRTAVRLLGCDRAFFMRVDRRTYTPVAGVSRDGPVALGAPNQPIDPAANFPSRAIATKQMLHLPDWAQIELPEHEQRIREMFGVKSALYLPLLRGDDCIGLLILIGSRPNMFGRTEIALAESFRDQALIAIENTRLFNETQEALERQTATADILKVIASSPSDVQPVFDAIVSSAAKLFEPSAATITTLQDGKLHWKATAAVQPNFDVDRAKSLYPVPFDPVHAPSARAILERRIIEIPDATAPGTPESTRRIAIAGGIGSLTFVPLIHEGKGVGTIILTSPQVGFRLSERQLSLLQTFADQAVIAIENTRLFNETKEALERQTATADILEVIASSPSDVQPVFDAIAESARRVLGGFSSVVTRVIGDQLHLAAFTTAKEGGREILERMFPRPISGSETHASVIRSGQIVIHADTETDGDEAARKVARARGFRSLLVVPMLRDGVPIGTIGVTKAEPQRFDDNTIGLLKTFADQAVIAIENVRLFNETKEALERQTATADILKVIASSPSDVQPVFDAIASSANRLIGGFSTAVHPVIDDVVHLAAFTPTNPESDAALQAVFPAHRSEVPVVARVEHGETWQIPDSEAGDEQSRRIARARGWRSATFTPLMHQGVFIGFISCTRREMGVLAEHHVQLLRTFADQAVIAIENARLFNETQEALEHQTATSQVLQTIGSSMADAQAVFERILDITQTLFGSQQLAIMLAPGDGLLHMAAFRGMSAEAKALYPTPIESTAADSAIRERQQCYFADAINGDNSPPSLARIAQVVGNFSLVVTPMIWEGRAIGSINVTREANARFSDKERALLRTFADQAVIAIENARLFNETKEALERQTATADILRVISQSPTDVNPVFEAVVLTARRLLRRELAFILHCDETTFRNAATAGPEGLLPIRNPGAIAIDPEANFPSRAIVSKRNQQFPDWSKIDLPEQERNIQKVYGLNSALYLPMLRGDQCIGVLGLGGQQARDFSETDIALAESFRDQALIAIENVRLFNETKEALERQTATADILKVIASSPSDVAPVFEAIATRAKSLVGGFSSTVFRFIDGMAYLEAFTPTTPEADEFLKSTSPRPVAELTPFRLTQAGEVMQIPDTEVLTDNIKNIARARGFRSMVFAPLMNKGTSIGFIAVTRVDPGNFADHHVQLLQTFADQAVIAIENARLFDEVQAKTRDLEESLQQQTATADVLKVISRSVFDLQTVLDTLVESAYQLCGARLGLLYLKGEEAFECKAIAGLGSEEASRQFKGRPIRAGRGTAAERVILSGEVHCVENLLEDPEVDPAVKHMIRNAGPGSAIGGARSTLAVPMTRDNAVIGVLVVVREETGPFPARQIEILQTFADQAVIAIENARLFDEVQARTGELSKSLDDLRAAQGRLIQTEKLASLGQLTAGIAHEIKNPLNFVNNFSALSIELTDELNDLLTQAELAEKLRGEVDELTTLLKDNLDKVVQHGKRADSIVKNMLLHSREGTGEHRPADVNALVDESLNLAYHGARAEKPQFNVTLKRDFDPDAGTIEAFPQEITRVLLNLISNGFYAVTKRKAENGSDGFEPLVTASTRGLADRVEIRIRDNGTGIPPEVKEKMFNPFFTTKPAGEGTGLGLSMSHDIVVKQHGGTIEVETEPGAFTEFLLVLPRTSAMGKGAGE